MPPKPRTPDLETIVLQLTETQDALAELIADVLPELARETGSRIEAVNKRLDTLEVATSEAVNRTHNSTAKSIAAVAKSVIEIDAYVRNMRNGLEVTIDEHLAKLKERILLIETRFA